MQGFGVHRGLGVKGVGVRARSGSAKWAKV